MVEHDCVFLRVGGELSIFLDKPYSTPWACTFQMPVEGPAVTFLQ